MKYYITKTGCWDNVRPCEDAIRVDVPYWQTRTLTEKAFNVKFKGREGLWRDSGRHHGVCNNGKWIFRQLGTMIAWQVEAESIDELYERYGQLVVTDREGSNPLNPDMEIEIYRGYRE
jgi:hypothetical protein